MVRMGRGETMSPAALPWHMDAVAEWYAQQDGQTLQAAGTLLLLYYKTGSRASSSVLCFAFLFFKIAKIPMLLLLALIVVGLLLLLLLLLCVAAPGKVTSRNNSMVSGANAILS